MLRATRVHENSNSVTQDLISCAHQKISKKIPKNSDEMMQGCQVFSFKDTKRKLKSRKGKMKAPQAWRHQRGRETVAYNPGAEAKQRKGTAKKERSTPPFNGIIRRPGLRKMKAVPSTTHGMIKFLVMGGILTLRSSRIIPMECAMVSGPEDQPPPMNKVKEERIKVAINPEHPEQTVMIGSDLTEKTRSKLCNLLQRSLDIFAWTPMDMTVVPRQIAEHKLNVKKGCPPVRQKKRGQAAERNIAIN
ncbi:hypothetical protein Tco_1144700 [Tanacetum coccineum]